MLRALNESLAYLSPMISLAFFFVLLLYIYIRFKQMALNKKMLSLDIINKNNQRYEKLLLEIYKNSNDDELETKILLLVDACEERIIYIKRGWVPREICLYWLNSICRNLSLYEKDESVNKQSVLYRINNHEKFLKKYLGSSSLLLKHRIIFRTRDVDPNYLLKKIRQ